MVLTSINLSLADLERDGADPYDLEPLNAASPDFARSHRKALDSKQPCTDWSTNGHSVRY